jgi:GGDEF domain-containing protein
VSVAFLDVREDAFDETLDKVIAILQVDVLARYDTHELAVFAVGLTGQVLAERIRACGPDVLHNLTVGVASLPAPLSMTGLLLHADEALHAAHRQGGLVVNNHASVTPDQ